MSDLPFWAAREHSSNCLQMIIADGYRSGTQNSCLTQMRPFSMWLKVSRFLLQKNMSREKFDFFFLAKCSSIGFEKL